MFIFGYFRSIYVLYCEMSQDILCAELDSNETFEETIRVVNNGSFDFAKCGQYVDKVKPFLGSSLESKIYLGLKEFVCDPNSRCSKCFPCVKRLLDASATGADYVDAYFTKDTTVGEEMITCAMKYLAKDGLLTQFTNSDGLNNRMCHGLDAIVVDQNDLKSMNVSRYINEKDYWLPQDCPVVILSEDIEISRELCIGSKQVGNASCSSRRGTSNDTKLDANAASIEVIFKPRNERLKGNGSSDLEVEVDSCSERTPERYVALQQHRTNSNRIYHEKTISDCVCNTENNTRCWINSLNVKTHDHRIERRASKLKVLIYQTTNDNSSTALTPAKVTSISIPCRPSHLIVRIFEAVPSLSESCLILTRKKFENGIQAACSCLNGILKKLNNAEVKELRLVCEIRPGYIDLILRRPRTSKPRLFLARLPTCRSHPKRESSCKHTCSYENSKGSQCRKNFDHSDCCFKEKAKFNERIAKETRHVMFCLSQSHCDSVSATVRSSSEDEKTNEKLIRRLYPERKISAKEINFVWTRKPVKEVSFHFTNEKEVDKSLTSSSDINTERFSESVVTVCDNADRSCFEEIVNNVPQNYSHNKQTTRSSNKEISNKIESCNSDSSCYPDSLKKVEQREHGSRIEICNSQQCLCRVLYEKTDTNVKEITEFPSCVKPQTAKKMNGKENGVVSHCLEKDTLNSTAKSERQQNGNGIIQMEKSNSMEQSVSMKTGASETKPTAELAEKFSADSICSLNSNYTEASWATKCSCCGEDLSDVEINIESKNVTISIESKLMASKTEVSIRDDETDKTKLHPEPEKPVEIVDRMFCGKNSIRTSSSKNCSVSQPSKTISDIDRENRGSIQNIRVTALYNRPESSNKQAFNYQIGRIISNDVCKNSAVIYESTRSLVEADGDHERVFASVKGTNSEQFSCRSNVSDSLLEDDLHTRDRERKPGSPRRRSSLRSKFRKKSKRSMCFAIRDSYSTQDLHDGKSKSRRKKVQNHSDCSCKNRFWNRAVTSGYLCGSFPAASLDRLKYLIRKKLRRLLLEEKNKSTNTSKTFLRNERYCVSAFSEKLNEGIHDICFSDRVNYSSCVTGDSGGAESNVSGRKKGILDCAVKSPCQKVTRCGVFKKMKIARIPSPACNSKLTGACCSTGEGRNDVRCKSEARNTGIADDRSTKRCFAEKNAKQNLKENENKLADDQVVYKKSQNRKKEKFEKQFCTESPSERNSVYNPSSNYSVCEFSTSSCEDAITKKLMCNMSSGNVENTRNSKNLRWFERRFESGMNCDKDFVIFYSDYERYVNDICAEFRLKLLQYVALCKSVKDTLIKRLQSDDCVIRSNST